MRFGFGSRMAKKVEGHSKEVRVGGGSQVCDFFVSFVLKRLGYASSPC